MALLSRERTFTLTTALSPAECLGRLADTLDPFPYRPVKAVIVTPAADVAGFDAVVTFPVTNVMRSVTAHAEFDISSEGHTIIRGRAWTSLRYAGENLGPVLLFLAVVCVGIALRFNLITALIVYPIVVGSLYLLSLGLLLDMPRTMVEAIADVLDAPDRS